MTETVSLTNEQLEKLKEVLSDKLACVLVGARKDQKDENYSILDFRILTGSGENMSIQEQYAVISALQGMVYMAIENTEEVLEASKKFEAEMIIADHPNANQLLDDIDVAGSA